MRPRANLALGLLAGVALDAVVPDPRRGHPVAAFGAATGALESRLYADSRTLGARSLRSEAAAVHGRLSAGDLDAARTQVTHLVGRDPSVLDADGIARAAV